MRIGKRDLSTFITRLLEPENVEAMVRMLKVHRRPGLAVFRELTSSGSYPARWEIRTGLGPRTAHLFHLEDFSTLNLIFCRRDYIVPADSEVVVDIGSNVGLSGLFWLTEAPRSTVYLFEPVPAHAERIKQNLSGLEPRYVFSDLAISDFSGEVEFTLEPTGKLGGIGREGSSQIKVECRHVNEVLEPILARHGAIDVLKVDVEGQEAAILRAIPEEVWRKIRVLNVEDFGAAQHLPDFFRGDKRGSAMRFENTVFGE